MTRFETEVVEIQQLLKYIECSVEHAGNLLDLVMTGSFDTDNSKDFKPISTLNNDALVELKSLVKKISSKSDSLQNKVVGLKLES